MTRRKQPWGQPRGWIVPADGSPPQELPQQMVGHKLISWPGRMPQKQLRSLWSPSLESIIMSPRVEPAGSFPPQAGALNRDGHAARWRGGLADHDHASDAGQGIVADVRPRPGVSGCVVHAG